MRRVVSVWLRQLQADLQQGSSTGSGVGTRSGSTPGRPDETASLYQLSLWCLRYAPLVAPDPPDGLWIDITGCAHLFGGGAVQGSSGYRRWNDSEGEAALGADLLARLEQLGFAARLAIADTPGAAHAMARHGAEPCMIVPAGKGPEALAELPVAALRLPERVLEALHRLGFATIAQVVTAPRAPLMRRFGPILLHRLDQALGHVPESINPILPEAAIAERLAFIEPLSTADAFKLVIARLTRSVTTILDKAGLGARRLDLIFECVDGTIQALRIGTSRPSRDAAHLDRLLTERLETIDPGPGVEAMRLAVTLAEPLAYVQSAAWTNGAGDAVNLAELIDRLENRLGHTRRGRPRLYRFAPVDSDVPERAVQRIPPLAPASHRSWPTIFPRPLRLLSPPQPVLALAPLPDQPPVAFTWRRTRIKVRRANGPERIHGEWWRRDAEAPAVRDYFQVEDEEGRRFWLFRRGDGVDPATGDLSWFLHGFF
jgi:protein ImuB